MPASYAHYRFGKLVLPNLPPEVRQCIQRFRRLYDTGLQGPDPFFYYNPFLKTSVGDLGNLFHNQTGQEFFTHACTQANSEAALSYLYGLLGHYCLDSVCHPFVNSMVNIGEARHVALESEFERHLMHKDGILDPSTADRAGRIKLTRGECMTAAAFFPPATGANISRSVGNMARCLRFLDDPNRARQEKLIRFANASLLEHLVPMEEVADYALLTGQLQEYYDRALELYPSLLQQLLEHKKTGEPLGEAFAPNFG